MPKLKAKSRFISYMKIDKRFMFTKNIVSQLCLKMPEFKDIILQYSEVTSP